MMVMLATPVIADSLLSYARLDGDSVRVVLVLADAPEVVGPRIFIRFQNGETGFRAPAMLDRSSGRIRLEVSVPREQLADGTWNLRLRHPGATSLCNLQARLLLDVRQPVALLFGKTPNIT